MHTALMRSLVLCGAILLGLITTGTTVAQGQECDADSVYPDRKDLRQHFKKGKKKAREDIARGKLTHKMFLSSYWHKKYANLMSRRYDVDVKFGGTGGVLFDPKRKARWDGYSCVSTAEIRRRFGEGIVDSTLQEAKGHYSGRQPTNLEVLREAQYTEEARRDSVEGRVIIKFWVPASGIPKNLEVVYGLGHGLDEEALRVAKKLRFRPADQVEKDTVFWQYAIPVRFSFSGSN